MVTRNIVSNSHILHCLLCENVSLIGG